MRTHLVSVGTSLLHNAERSLSARQIHRAPTDGDLRTFLRDEPPERASAEHNVLFRELADGDRVAFFHSDTVPDTRCAEALTEHLIAVGHEADAVLIPDLRTDDPRVMERGLRAFVGLLSERIEAEQAEGREVLVNATGGFKAQTGLSTLVGALHRVPVYYIFESQTANVRLPRLPLSWDVRFAEEYDDALEWLVEPRTRTDIARRVDGRNDPEAFWDLLVEEPDGRLTLSAAGYAVADRPPPEPAGAPGMIEEVRGLLQGRALVIVGGVSRPHNVERLTSAFAAPVDWVETRVHQAPGPLEVPVARPNVGLVVLLKGLGGHAFEPALRTYCDRHGRPFVRIRTGSGYNPAQIARAALEQVGDRLRDAAGL